MSANTKIVVLRSREVLYTILLLFVGILIILVLLSLFLPSDSASPTESLLPYTFPVYILLHYSLAMPPHGCKSP